MPNSQNAANNHEYRSLPVTALVEAASNPRKRFDERSIEELGTYAPRSITCLLCR
jgi:ribosomal protein S16